MSILGVITGMSISSEFELAKILGASSFRKRYGLRFAYLAGAMYKGIASKELVVEMGKHGYMGFLGTGGQPTEKIESDLHFIRHQLAGKGVFGANVINHTENPDAELELIKMYINFGVQVVEASAYIQISEALVYYRVSGLKITGCGEIFCQHNIIAKLSRPEVAKRFLAPPPQAIVASLLQRCLITQEQSELSQKVPMCSDICVEADSGGHTDRGIAMVILPSIQSLRDSLSQEYGYEMPVHVGLAGGIGVPQAALSAFIMGADFIVTGSINQCTVEAGTSDSVKDLLQMMDVQDTDYAPAGDMFEIGAKVQVLKKGSLFAPRANKLYETYMLYKSWEEVPESLRTQLEQKCLKKTFAEIWQEVEQYNLSKGNYTTIEKAHKSAKHKLSLVFKRYFAQSTQFALQGDLSNKSDFQVHTGPALGAFNQWVKGTPLCDWRERHAAHIADKIMTETARLMIQQCQNFMPVVSNK